MRSTLWLQAQVTTSVVCITHIHRLNYQQGLLAPSSSCFPSVLGVHKVEESAQCKTATQADRQSACSRHSKQPHQLQVAHFLRDEGETPSSPGKEEGGCGMGYWTGKVS
jgi:hypothetical protein